MPLTNEQLKELHAAILSGFDQDGLTLLVRFEMGEVLGNLVALDGGMEAIVFQLIEKLEQRGTTDVLVQAACKARPGNDLVREYARKYGRGAAARTSVAMAQQVGVVLKNVADAARPAEDQGKVEEVVRDFAEDMGGARAVTAVLKKYKVLHDQLHEIDHRLYGVIRQTVASFRGGPDEKVTLNEYTGQLRDCAATANEAARGLPLGQAELGWIGNVDQAVTLLAAAIADAGGAADGYESQRRDAPLMRAVALLRTVIGREPSRINGQMMLLAGQLQQPLDGLTKALGELEQADPARADQVRAARSDLENLRPRLLGLVIEHDSWQRIDNQLRLVPDSATQPLDDVVVIWPDLASATRELCNPRREVAWAANLQRAADLFDVAVTAGKAEEQRLALNDFARMARRRFWQVDKELDLVCSNLVQIADPLTRLLGLIGR